MNKPCPFCGDTRDASIEEHKFTSEVGSDFRAVCQCCGAQGPIAATRGAALIEWDERRQPGETEGFRQLVDQLSGRA